MKTTMLERAIHGRKVIRYVKGLYSFRPNSNLYKNIIDVGLTLDDIGLNKKYDIAVGARAGRPRSTGYYMAIVENKEVCDE